MAENDRESETSIGAAPNAETELTPPVAVDESHAWSLDDGPEWKPPFWTAGKMTAAAAGAAVAALVVAAGIGGYHLRGDPVASPPPETSAAVTTTAATMTAPPPPPPTTKTVTVEKPAPVDYDQRFIENLRAEGWNVWDTAIAKHAHTVCQALRNGDTVQSISQQMITVGLLYEHETGPFITTAMNTYPNCP